MKRIITGLMVVLLLLAVGGISIYSVLFNDAFAQSIGYDRIRMLWLVRDIIGEPQATYYADSTINRLIHYSQMQTKVALGDAGDAADTLILTTLYETSYAYPVSAVRGEGAILGVLHKKAGIFAKKTGLRRVPMELVGRANGSYAVANKQIHLGFWPPANDSLWVYYVERANDLAADDSTLSVGDEDVLAVANLAISMLLHRDKQVQEAQVFYGMWKDYVDRKRGGVVGVGQ